MISFWFNDVQFTCLTSYTSNTLIAKAENFDLREKKCSKIDLKINDRWELWAPDKVYDLLPT